MRFWFCLTFTLACSAVACSPETRCGGKLYYDGTSCRPCPANAEFDDGVCVCKDSEYYEFVDNACKLIDGAMPPEDEPARDGGAAAASCSDYCDFQEKCIANNGIAAAALSDVVKGLKADDPDACTSACEDDTGGSGEDNAVVACFEAGRGAAMCEGDQTATGLGGAIMLMGSCCKGKSDALCKSICAALKANAAVGGMIDFCP